MSESETIRLFIEVVSLAALLGVFVGYLFAFFTDRN